MAIPRYLQRAGVDPAGLREVPSLPYHVESRDVLRLVEDLHGLLFEVNGQLVAKGYQRLEELLDPAGFSGLLSRAVVEKMSRLSKNLVRNEYHNGYPDLLPYGVYARNRTAHGTEGGLEVKASRSAAGWQAHGPRAGWFLIIQFALDNGEEKALVAREPTRVLTAMVASLEIEDWSWQPAGEGKIRSGTASVKQSGCAKMRAGAIWVDPTYEETHQELLRSARRKAISEQKTTVAINALGTLGGVATRAELDTFIATEAELLAADVKSAMDTAVRQLILSERVEKTGKGPSAVLKAL